MLESRETTRRADRLVGKRDSHNLFAFRKILSVEALETLHVSTKPKTSHCLEESGARWAFVDVCSTLGMKHRAIVCKANIKFVSKATVERPYAFFLPLLV